MSDVDHDAAMRRTVERQQIVEDLQRDICASVEQVIPEGFSNIALVWASAIFLLNASVSKGSYRRLTEEQEGELGAHLEKIIDKVSRASMSESEKEWMLLDLGKKLIESGTSPITSAYSIWESETFRKKADPMRYPLQPEAGLIDGAIDGDEQDIRASRDLAQH